MNDTASSASRQHYVDTGHYGTRMQILGSGTEWLVCHTCEPPDEPLPPSCMNGTCACPSTPDGTEDQHTP